MKSFLLPVLFALAQVSIMADGGAVQLRQEAGGLVITVFSSPTPLSVGPADISLLLQKKDGLDPVLDASVSLLFREDASTRFEARPLQANARNKLLYATPVTFTKPGKWQMAATISHSGVDTEAAAVLDVAPAPASASAYAGYIVFPLTMTVLFAIREVLIRRSAQAVERGARRVSVVRESLERSRS
jgi:hypothetical protein